MESESIVYGCIRDWPGDSMERRMRRAANRRVLDSLPGGEAWPFLGREMFSRCEQSGAGLYQTQIIHFGASYQTIEYEWSLWVEQFEALLRRLYWASAVVHLETEVNGSHTFRWESERGFHTPPGERPAGPLRLGAGGRAAVINYLWFVLAAFCEIAGCYAFYLWLRLGKSALWVLPGLLSLTLFALLLTRVEASYAGRAYAAYGGIYVAASLFWLAFVERSRPLWSDWLGVALCVVGASFVLFGPRLSQ